MDMYSQFGKVGYVLLPLLAQISHFKFGVLHTSFACAYHSQVFDLVFHHVYDTLEGIEIHHHNVYGTNRIYNNKWDFSEFC